MNQLKNCSILCQTVYNDDIEYTIYDGNPSEDAQMMSCEIDGTLFLVFRGTESKEDVLNTLQFFKNGFLGCHIHSGFHKQYASIRLFIVSIINNYKEKESNMQVICTGHSLGGALAMIAALDIQTQMGVEVSCITFGAPRVGNWKFKEMYCKNVSDSYRFVNWLDPIPCLPPRFLFYYHCDDAIYLKKDTKEENRICSILNSIIESVYTYILYPMNFMGFIPVKVHGIEEYCDRIEEIEST